MLGVNAIVIILIAMSLLMMVNIIPFPKMLIPLRYTMRIMAALCLAMAGFAILLGPVGIPLIVLEVGFATWMIWRSRRL